MTESNRLEYKKDFLNIIYSKDFDLQTATYKAKLDGHEANCSHFRYLQEFNSGFQGGIEEGNILKSNILWGFIMFLQNDGEALELLGKLNKSTKDKTLEIVRDTKMANSVFDKFKTSWRYTMQNITGVEITIVKIGQAAIVLFETNETEMKNKQEGTVCTLKSTNINK